MFFATMTFWMLVAVFTACAIFRLWAGVINPKVLNLILFPGTLVAQVGHITGVLLTGGNMDDVKNLIMTDMSNDGTKAKSKTTLLSASIIAALPMIACSIGLYMMLVMSGTGWNLLDAAGADIVTFLPLSAISFWDWIRSAINMLETVSIALASRDFNQIENWVLVYFLTSLTVRLAPLPGTQRGTVVSILVVGASMAILSAFSTAPRDAAEEFWMLGSFSVAMLLLLLILSMFLRGGFELFRLIINAK
jgi:hypothetical protein